jgi:hypothetical protein
MMNRGSGANACVSRVAEVAEIEGPSSEEGVNLFIHDRTIAGHTRHIVVYGI